ncbi:MAG TPA: hypothetical protein PKE06_10415 [Flavilitoribacter sp.]|nr:hypothetical protein [Flavilitoribacter sp.]HMQ86277.1 hypothetical protein [Flavilitoribacter sp.]
MKADNKIKITIAKKEVLKKQTGDLGSLWQALKKEEMPAIRKFLESPFFNQDQRITELFDRFRTAIYTETQERMNGRTLLEKLFPGMPGEKALNHLGKLLERLRQLILDYLACEEMAADPLLKGRIQAESLKKRQFSALFRQESQKLDQRLKKAPASIRHFADTWWVSHLRYFHQTAEQYSGESGQFKTAYKRLLHFFELCFWRYYCENTNRGNILSGDQQEEETSRLYQFFRERKNPEPVVRLYRMAARLLADRDDVQHYDDFKAAMIRDQKKADREDRLVLLKFALNTAFYLYEKGLDRMATEMFFWSKTGVDQELFLLDGVISDDEFLNVSLCAAAAGEFAYQERFTAQYGPFLEAGVREKATELARAYSHFYRQECGKTVRILEQHFGRYSQDELKYTLRAKLLLLCCRLWIAVKTDADFREYHKTHEAFRKFISRKSVLAPGKRLPYLNFLSISGAIAEFCSGVPYPRKSREAGKAALMEKLTQTSQVTSRPWLRRFIQEL